MAVGDTVYYLTMKQGYKLPDMLFYKPMPRSPHISNIEHL